MSDAAAAPVGILLIEQDSVQRKSLRRPLDGDGHAVLAVNSIGEALARLRLRHYELVVCTSRHGGKTLADDYGLLIDKSGLLARSTTGYELYLPGVGIDARAVLIIPTSDPLRVRTVVRDVWSRLERTGAPQSPGGAGSQLA